MASMRLIITTLVLLSVLGASKAQLSNISDMDIALAEMKAGSYNGFAMLLQMLMESGSPIPTRDVTFLMPNDTLLADQTSLAFNALPDFIIRHTIRSPLKFNNLLLIPNGTIIPSPLHKYGLIVSNHGSRNFFVNNARIVIPDVCRASSFIACHGISDVLISPRGTSPPPHSPPPHPSPSPSPAPVPQAPHIAPPPHSPPPHSSPSPSPSPVPQAPPPSPPIAPQPAPATAPAPAPSSSDAMPRAYISVLVLFISAIVVGLANP
ncbi:hypothetical protein SUGI_0548250 [Cryptomeria japonica]|uniref:FAS1 domain-containing protein SELMODRAFT_448915 n=1 Tax=Cryptomeria japonica TaxID=3369 RepID=UPI002408B1A4|nr:FAS1 domain-containing protein SELMODRAFT_448915 [Cryptomeria japonica]GLJ27913.1 hypothetical protein SUGI_0548250 [Cryptomeria japonica]